MTTTQSPPALPPDLAGWRWVEQHYTSPPSTEYALQSPDDDWATKVYARPDRAIAEAKRRVLSQPKTAPLIPLDAIRTDGGTQARAGLNPETVADYADIWADLARQQNGLSLMPPIVLYHDGTDYWLADGFHRLAAYRQFLDRNPLTAAQHALAADVRPGTRRDAVLHACGANAAHGLRRTNADKRRAVETLLRDDEWRQWSDSEIARRCLVSHTYATKIRQELYPETLQDSRTVERNGTTYQMAPAAPAPRVCARCDGPWGAPGSMVTPGGKLCQDCAPVYLETLAKTQAAIAAGEQARAAPPCEHCHAPATTRRNLRGMLASRCAACDAEQARLQADEEAGVESTELASGFDRELCHRAEGLGAQIDYLGQRADGRLPVLPPPGWGSPGQWTHCDAGELSALCDRWEAAKAAQAPATRSDWWNCGLEIKAIHAAIDRHDRAGAIRAALALAASLAPADLASIAEELSDAEYEALAALRRPVEEVGT